METLRDRFSEYLQNTSGPVHLAELASECQRVLLKLSSRYRCSIGPNPLLVKKYAVAITGIKLKEEY